MIDPSQLKEFLDQKVVEFNQASFIEQDPISIPHKYHEQADIEIVGFIVATISWGNRKSILASGEKLMRIMGDSPYDFVMNFDVNSDYARRAHFVHRTFNTDDFVYFITRLQHLYSNVNSLEDCFVTNEHEKDMWNGIVKFRNLFFDGDTSSRTQKHVSNPLQNSACKRIHMFLRWMVRRDGEVDFGLWKKLNPSQLLCPLDVHSGTVARNLGLLLRTQNDGKATDELTEALRKFDAKDPIKYDFALFGLGVSHFFEKT